MCCDIGLIGLDGRILDYHVHMSLLGPQDLPNYLRQPRTSLIDQTVKMFFYSSMDF